MGKSERTRLHNDGGANERILLDQRRLELFKGGEELLKGGQEPRVD